MNPIEINPQVCNGKPVIRGTRIPVTVVLDQLASGCAMNDIQRKYPELTLEQIASALHYCHAMIDHSDVQDAGRQGIEHRSGLEYTDSWVLA